jgi:GT2 family glycosyltransferase
MFPAVFFLTEQPITFGNPPPLQRGRLLAENIVCSVSLIRKKAWKEAGGYDVHLTDGYEDWDFWLTLADNGWLGVSIPELMFYHRTEEHVYTQEELSRHESYKAYIYSKHHHRYPQHQLYENLLEWLKDETSVRNKMRGMLGDRFRLDPIVSVVIPCYNYGQFVEDAVDSCLNSTFQDIEIIVVDNGSTDKHTIRILEQLNKPKTRVVKVGKNRSLPHGRNVGISRSMGRYILPLDADDMIHPAMIEKMVRVLEGNPKVGFVTAGLQYFGTQYWEWLPPSFDFKRLLEQNTVCVASLFRKVCWSEVGGYNESMKDGYEDWDFWISVAEKGWLGDSIPEILFFLPPP